jgi:hypothetical protein
MKYGFTILGEIKQDVDIFGLRNMQDQSSMHVTSHFISTSMCTINFGILKLPVFSLFKLIIKVILVTCSTFFSRGLIQVKVIVIVFILLVNNKD